MPAAGLFKCLKYSRIFGLPLIGVILLISRSSVSVQWGAPAFDGGSPIIGYILEHSVEGEDDWYKSNVGTSSVHTTEFTVTGLRPEKSYLFRVAAINAVGTGSHALVCSNSRIKYNNLISKLKGI